MFRPFKLTQNLNSRCNRRKCESRDITVRDKDVIYRKIKSAELYFPADCSNFHLYIHFETPPDINILHASRSTKQEAIAHRTPKIPKIRLSWKMMHLLICMPFHCEITTIGHILLNCITSK